VGDALTLRLAKGTLRAQVLETKPETGEEP